MHVTTERSGDVVIVTLRGKLNATTSPSVQDQLLAAVGEGGRRFVLDCGGLEFISSAGLRVFYRMAKALEPADGSMAFCAVGDMIMTVFSMVDLPSDFPVYGSRSEAVGSFG